MRKMYSKVFSKNPSQTEDSNTYSSPDGQTKGFITNCGKLYFNNTYWTASEVRKLANWLSSIADRLEKKISK